MSILVLGASGYVGGELADYLETQVAVTRSSRGGESGYQFSESITSKIPESTTLIVMTIGSTELDSKSYYNSTISTLASISRLIDLHQRDGRKIPIVYFSTFHVYGRYTGLVDENTKLLPRGIYALVHKQAEDILANYSRESGTKIIVIRPTNIFGTICGKLPTKRLSMIPMCFILEAKQNGCITIRADKRVERDYVHIEIVAKVIMDISIRINMLERYSILNISSGTAHEIGEVASMIKAAFRQHDKYIRIIRPELKNSEGHTIKYEKLVVNSRARDLVVDTGKLDELSLGNQLPSIVRAACSNDQ